MRIALLAEVYLAECSRTTTVPLPNRAKSYLLRPPRNWMIFLRSRLEGRPSGAGLNAMPARRSAATLARNSRLASVSR